MFPSESRRPPAPPHEPRPPAGPVPAATLLPCDLAAAYGRFVDHARTAWGHSEASIKGYRCAYQNFTHFLVSADGLALPTDVRAFAIDAWVQWNRRRRLKEISLNAYWRGLRTFYRYLAQIEGVPTPFAGLPMPKPPKTLPKARSPEECRRVLAAARNYPWPHPYFQARAVAMLGVMLFAGLRKMEVVQLEYADLNFALGTLSVKRGKGRSGGTPRIAYMPVELRQILLAFRKEREALSLDGPELFLSPRTNRGISESQLIRTVRVVRRASGVPFSMHSLRHSFVSFLLAAGTPIHVARELAGHEDIETTMRYARVFDEDKAYHIKRLRLG
jgi:site-specific recombinase XerD